MPGKLFRKIGQGGTQYFLEGRPIDNGAFLELLLTDDQWLLVRLVHIPEKPCLHIELGSDGQQSKDEAHETIDVPLMVAELPLEHGIFRWPDPS